MSDRPRIQMWTASQRGVLIAFVLILAAFLGWQIWSDRQLVPNPQTAPSPRSAELPGRVDPNTATLTELSLLPGLGRKRASEIVAYRREFFRTRPQGIPFQRDQDLLKVNGVGVSVLEDLEPYLAFPASTTQPTTHARG